MAGVYILQSKITHDEYLAASSMEYWSIFDFNWSEANKMNNKLFHFFPNRMILKTSNKTSVFLKSRLWP